MKWEIGDLTVGDIGVSFVGTADVDLTGLNVDFKLLKPSGAFILRDATVSGFSATYTSVSGDIDESGKWRVYAYNATTGYHYTKESGNVFMVRPLPEDMAVG